MWHANETGKRVRGRAFNPRVVKRLVDYLRPYRLSVIWALILVSVTSGMHLIGPYLL